jgi:exodeoxyribonuclease VII large subunit
MVAQHKEALERFLIGLYQRLHVCVRRMLELASERLQSREQRLKHPAARLADLRLRIDEHVQRLEYAIRQRLGTERHLFFRLMDRLLHLSPTRKITERRSLLEQYWLHLELFFGQQFQRKRQELQRCVTQLDGLSPLNILARGYSITTTWPQGELVRSAKQVKKDDAVKVRLHEGSLCCKVVRPEE